MIGKANREAFMNWFTLLLSCEGQIKRRPYLIGLLPVLLLFVLAFLYARFVKGALPLWADLLVMAAIALEALYFLTCLSLKRLRDIGRPDWFVAVMLSPLLVAAFFLVQQKFFPLGNYEVAVPLYTTAIVLAVTGLLWVLVELMFRRSLADR